MPRTAVRSPRSATKLQLDGSMVRAGKMLTLGPNGELPTSKVPSANILWDICDQLRRDDVNRSIKRERIYKQYKRFAPTEYSVVIKKGAPWSSNVCWGQLKFMVDGQKSVFYDMASESPELVDIQTKFGDPEDRLEFSEKISAAFDETIRSWPEYLINTEQDIEEMLLNGKGIEVWETKEGWQSRAFSNNDVLVPNKTRFDFKNGEIIVIRKEYSPNELYRCIQDKEVAETKGWNYNAVIDAIRYTVTPYNNLMTREDWIKNVAAGEVNLTSYVTEYIRTYEAYIQEFDGTITKEIILQDYSGIWNAVSNGGKNVDVSQEDVISKSGFLFSKLKHADGWDEVFSTVTDSVGSGKWHEIQSQAEQAFIACRQYDIVMNRIMDAIFVNMMLMLTGNNPDANKKLREMEFLPMFTLPDGVSPVQVKLDIPTTESLQALTFVMRDTYAGMAVYKTNQATHGGRQRTRGEAELDAANDAQVSGTQAKRFNEGRSQYFRQLYKRFVNCLPGEVGYEYVEKFYELLDLYGVPRDAAKWENIRSVKSKMVSGAGSPSMKLIMAEKLIGYTGMVAANPGQEKAIRQACAYSGGVGNLEAFRPKQKNPNPPLIRIISNENAAMSVDDPNPDNFKVFPTDPHLEHIAGHYSDMMSDLSNLVQMHQSHGDPEEMMTLISRLKIKGGHSYAHLHFVAQDKTKKSQLEGINQNYQKIQQVLDQIEPDVQKALQAKQEQQGQQPNMDPDLQLEIAKKQIELSALQQKENLKLATKASAAQLNETIRENRAANDIAISRARANEDIRQKKTGTKKPTT